MNQDGGSPRDRGSLPCAATSTLTAISDWLAIRLPESLTCFLKTELRAERPFADERESTGDRPLLPLRSHDRVTTGQRRMRFPIRQVARACPPVPAFQADPDGIMDGRFQHLHNPVDVAFD